MLFQIVVPIHLSQYLFLRYSRTYIYVRFDNISALCYGIHIERFTENIYGPPSTSLQDGSLPHKFQYVR